MVNESNKLGGVLNSELIRTSPININSSLNKNVSLKCTQLKLSPDLGQVKENTYSYSTGNVLNKKINVSVSPATLNTNQSSNHKNSHKSHSQIKSNLTIFHQNIRGLRTKTNEILCHFSSELPHILCFTEHHLTVPEIQAACIDNYTLSTYYCRKQTLKGGVCIFINNNLTFSS
jgi:hypothetical protein